MILAPCIESWWVLLKGNSQFDLDKPQSVAVTDGTQADLPGFMPPFALKSMSDAVRRPTQAAAHKSEVGASLLLSSLSESRPATHRV